MQVGLLMHLNKDAYGCIAHAAKLGFTNGQLAVWDMDLYCEDSVEQVKRACRDFDFTVTAVWCGWSGPVEWGYPNMYASIGLVPPAWRSQRTKDLLDGAAFARAIGVKDIITHMGFLPDDPFNADHIGVVQAIRYICRQIEPYGQRFLFETGEELPGSLLLFFKEVGMENVGVNFDPANMLINGRANPLDAMDRLAPYVYGIHGKDGVYPQGFDSKGKEVQIGQGGVDFQKLLQRLLDAGYTGNVTIEREIPEGQERDLQLIEEKAYLEAVIQRLTKKL